MVDLVSISLVKSFGLKPCACIKHQHVVPQLEGVGQTSPKTYGFYHLKALITDRFNRSFSFVRPFLAVDRGPRDSQVLLGRPALKDFKINILNSDDSFEFERNPKVTKISPHRFAREFAHHVSCFQVKLTFKPDIDEPDDEDDEISSQTTRKPTATYDLSHIPLHLRQKFRDFFDTVKAERLPSNRATDHAIAL